MVKSMSAAELLEQVKALPPDERRKFVDAILELPPISEETRQALARKVVWPDIMARLREDFGDRVFDNPILAEREESDR